MTAPWSLKNFAANLPKLQNRDERVSLSGKSRMELMDLLQREEKLCKNKKFLEKLPDKGAKMLKFYEEVKNEILRRDNQDELCGELAKLTVDKSKIALDRLEWTGEYRADEKESVEEDDTNPFRILATHSSTEASKHKNVKYEPRTESAKEEIDLVYIDAYAKELCDRFNSSVESSKKFYTNKPLNRIPEKKNIENSEAVLSNGVEENSHSAIKMLSLKESIAVQHQQNKALKEIELQAAIKKLHTKINIENQTPLYGFYDYRDHSSIDSEDECNETASVESETSDDE